MKKKSNLEILSLALVDCAIIIGAAISKNWWLLILLIFNNLETQSD